MTVRVKGDDEEQRSHTALMEATSVMDAREGEDAHARHGASHARMGACLLGVMTLAAICTIATWPIGIVPSHIRRRRGTS